MLTANSASAFALRRGATRTRVVVTLIGLALVLAADATPGSPLASLRNWVFDAYQRYWPSARSGHPIVIIDIDAASIRHIGQWPWPRDHLARLVEAAAAARVIGIDLLLTEPDRLAGKNRETDTTLAASLRHLPVVLAAAAATPTDEAPLHPTAAATPVFEVGNDPRTNLPHYQAVSWPQEVLASAASGTGLVTVPPEADGIMRRMPTVAAVGSLLLPSFGVEIVRVAGRTDRISFRSEATGGSTLEIGDRIIPTDPAGGVWPRYASNAAVPSVRAEHVLRGEVDREIFRDRIVLIGTSAPGLADAFETPLRRLQSGVSIQAELVDCLLAGDVVSRPAIAPALERVLAAALAIAAMLRFGKTRDAAFILISLSTVILLGIGSLGAFGAAGLLLDATLPAVALLTAGAVVLAERIPQEVRARQRLADALREAQLRLDAENARESLAMALDAAGMGFWDADLIRSTWQRSPRYDEIFGQTEGTTRWDNGTLLARTVPEDRDGVTRSLNAAVETGALHLSAAFAGPTAAFGQSLSMAACTTEKTARRPALLVS